MPLYIAMTNWADQGVKNLKESGNRAEVFKKMATEMGCTVHGLFFTMGRYDIVSRIEALDDATVSALALKLGTPRLRASRPRRRGAFPGDHPLAEG